jgi:hypothetical protein
VGLLILYWSTSHLYRFTHTWPFTQILNSTYMRSAWWANQSSVHLLYDHLARGSMTVIITFIRYEKYVHVTTTYTGFIRGILRGVRYAKLLRVLFLHRRSPSWTTLVLYSRAVFIFNEPTYKYNHNILPTQGVHTVWGQGGGENDGD